MFFINYLDEKTARKDKKWLRELRKTKVDLGELRRTSTAGSVMILDIDDDGMKCSDLKEFGIEYWCTVSSSFCIYVAIVNSVVIASGILEDRFKYDDAQTGFMCTLPYLVTSITSPLFGYVVDRFQKQMPTIFCGAFILIIAHTILLMLPDCNRCWNSIIPFVLLGLAYSTYSVDMYPLVGVQVS